MRSFKKLGTLVAVFALSAIGAGNAAAANFTYSAAGEFSGKALETQVFTTSAGKIQCNTAATSGQLASTAFANLHATVHYSGCTAFGLGGVHINPATYNFTANGTVHLKNNIAVTVTLGGCTLTINGEQSVGEVDYANSGANNIKVTPTVSGLHYKGSGGLCGSTTLTNGTYAGASEWSRVGEGQIRFDP